MTEEESLDQPREIQRLLFERGERLKELAAINQTTDILKEGKPLDETLQQLAKLFPSAWQYPEYTVCCISFGGKEYRSPGYIQTRWVQRQSFDVIDGRSGYLDIYYLKDFVQLDEGPFLKEERHLITNLASSIAGYLNSLAAREFLKKSRREQPLQQRAKLAEESAIPGRQLLQRFLNQNNYSRDI